jgi:hypothetical protein
MAVMKPLHGHDVQQFNPYAKERIGKAEAEAGRMKGSALTDVSAYQRQPGQNYTRVSVTYITFQ